MHLSRFTCFLFRDHWYMNLRQKNKIGKNGQNFAFYMLKNTPARKKVHHCHLWRLWLIWAMKVSMAFSNFLNSTPTPKALPHWFRLVQTGSDWFGLARTVGPDLEFVKKFTRPNFWAKEFYTVKTRKSRLFSQAINSKNASISVIWSSFG